MMCVIALKSEITRYFLQNCLALASENGNRFFTIYNVIKHKISIKICRNNVRTESVKAKLKIFSFS